MYPEGLGFFHTLVDKCGVPVVLLGKSVEKGDPSWPGLLQ